MALDHYIEKLVRGMRIYANDTYTTKKEIFYVASNTARKFEITQMLLKLF